MEFQTKFIYFVTGASGVGKTTLVSSISEKYNYRSCLFLHFDAIGIPSAGEMQKEFGSPSRWQKAKTFEWVKRLINVDTNQKVVLEGQVDLTFIYEAFLANHFKDYSIILVDCDEHEMESRLNTTRRQPELFTSEMRNWRAHLRHQAEQFHAGIIDTTALTVQQGGEKLKTLLGLAT